MAAIEKGNIRSMPNKIMPALPRPTPGALLMGDAFNMRHPLTGGGMTVALADIVLLRDMLRPLRSFNDSFGLCDYLKAFYTRRKVGHQGSLLLISILNSFSIDCLTNLLGCLYSLWLLQSTLWLVHSTKYSVHPQI